MYHINDICSVNFRGHRLDVVVVSLRRIQRGRFAGKMEYTLVPLEAQSKTMAYTIKGDSNLGPAWETWDTDEVDEALERYRDEAARKSNAKAARVARGRDAIGDIDYSGMNYLTGSAGGTRIAPGDEVLVRYRNALPRWEVVVKVNFKTGKVAIDRGNGAATRAASDPDLLLLEEMLGCRKRRHSAHRWLHPDCIIDVRHPDAR